MVGKILVVDDVSTNRIVFKVKLAAAGYDPLMAADGASCLAVARAERPDLVLLDLELPDMSGTDVLERLRADPLTRRIPVIMFSAGRNEAARIAALNAGADDFLTKPIDDQTLLARLRSFMRAGVGIEGLAPQETALRLLGMAEPPARFEPPGLVAIVMARPDTALHLQRELASRSKNQFITLTPDQAFRDIRPEGAESPDIYLIEADLDRPGAGLRLMSELRSRTRSRDAAFCILNRHALVEVAAIAFDLGANDQVDSAMHPTELSLRLRTLLRRKREEDRLRASVQDGLRLAMIDPLTGLHNRRYGVAQISVIAEHALAAGSDYAVIVADLDRFKTVNDRWGHAAGDAVLVEVARRLAVNLRQGDLIARIGGEEFLIALPDTSLTEARIVAERLCKCIEAVPMSLPGGDSVSVTISIGLALSNHAQPMGATDPAAHLVDRADQALLASKSLGRNMVTICRNAA